MLPELEHKLDNLPSSPGVYIFKGQGGVVLYVGKARSLKSRRTELTRRKMRRSGDRATRG